MKKWRWLATAKYILIMAAILGLFSCSRTAANSSTAGNAAGVMPHNGIQRTYRLHVPSSCTREAPVPLVLALHGGGGSGQKMEELSGLSDQSDNDGFIVVYPDAVENHWNDGRGLQNYRSQRENIDDVGFIASLIDALAKIYPVDRKRVYVTGVSNGAMMSYRLACELTDTISAIAPVVGALAANTVKTCSPSGAVAVLIIGGTADPLVPWEGGNIKFFRRKLGNVVSFADTLDFWVSHNRCPQTPEVSWLPDTDPHDGTRVKKTIYRQCTQGVEVALYEIRGGGHTWPSGSQYLPEYLIGKTSRDFKGSEVIWKFFKKFSK
jgi:polyhydroxybutyrate depolymerase